MVQSVLQNGMVAEPRKAFLFRYNGVAYYKIWMCPHCEECHVADHQPDNPNLENIVHLARKHLRECAKLIKPESP